MIWMQNFNLNGTNLKIMLITQFFQRDIRVDESIFFDPDRCLDCRSRAASQILRCNHMIYCHNCLYKVEFRCGLCGKFTHRDEVISLLWFTEFVVFIKLVEITWMNSYKSHNFQCKLESGRGIYRIFQWWNYLSIVLFPNFNVL